MTGALAEATKTRYQKETSGKEHNTTFMFSQYTGLLYKLFFVFFGVKKTPVNLVGKKKP